MKLFWVCFALVLAATWFMLSVWGVDHSVVLIQAELREPWLDHKVWLWSSVYFESKDWYHLSLASCILTFLAAVFLALKMAFMLSRAKNVALASQNK